MKHWFTALLAAAACMLPSLAGAASYTFPGSLPPGCSGSGPSYTCTALTLGQADTVTINAPKPATITVNGDFVTDTAQINQAGNASDLTLRVNGTLRLGYEARIKANIQATSVDDSGGGRVVITGNLTATGGNIVLNYLSSVTGNLGNNGSGNITVGEGGTIGGTLAAGSGAVSLGFRSRVDGNLSTTGTITTGQESRIGGTLTGGAGNVSIGYGATVVGALSTTTGTISFAQNAVAQACVRSTGSASITLGYQSNVNSVCCGGSCGNSCVVNNSTYAMPPACAATTTPTLTAGVRYSFESYDVPGSYIRHQSFLGYVHPVSASSDSLTRSDSTYIARAGLNNAACWSFEAVNYPGYYLRHQDFVMKLHAYSSAALYLADATFCLRNGLANASSISLETTNYPGYYIQRKTDNTLIIATTDGSAAVNGRATFIPRAGWAPTVDHYELSAPSSAVSCQTATLTVTACADASNPCTNPVTGFAGQSATLATSAGTLGATTVTFGANGTATTTLAHANASNGGTATVTLSGETMPASAARRCCLDGTSCSTANSCTTTFNTAGFIVAASANGAAATVPTQTAGVSSGSWMLRAVRTNTTTRACEAALSGATTVNWGLQCNDPTTCSAGNRMTVTGSSAVAVAGNANGASSASTAVPMTFDANGNAPFSFTYADVGRVTLLASKAAGGTLQAALSGSSNAFVVKPSGFVLSGIRCASYAAGSCATTAIASPGNNPGATSATGSAFLPAGRPFSATVTAVDAAGNATPNYGRETAAEGVLLTAALVLPAGGNAPALSNASAFGSFTSGAATGNTFAWPEVGIITLTPAVADGSYLGVGNVTGTASGNVGRFIPAGFDVGNFTVSHRSAMSCSPASTFSYMGESMNFAFRLTARNVDGATTQNYTGSFAKLSPVNTSSFNAAGISGTTPFKPGGRLTPSPATGAWANGVADVTLPVVAERGASPDGPFSTAQFGIAPVDRDGVGMLTLNLDTDAPANGNDRALLGQVHLRYGRLRLQNAMGAANRPLRLPLTAQYWDSASSTFKTNTLDSCTRITSANLSFGNFRRTLTAADAVMSPGSVTVDPTANTYITLAAPGGGRVGSVDVALALGADTTDASCLSWTPTIAATAGANLNAMRGSWCGNTALRDPSARATWGLYRGSNGVIYQRENY